MLKSIVSLSILFSVSAIFVGCSTQQPKPCEISCKNGHLDKDKCVLINEDVMATVMMVSKEKNGYLITLSDERGRKFEITSKKEYKIGDILTYNIYEDPIKKCPNGVEK